MKKCIINMLLVYYGTRLMIELEYEFSWYRFIILLITIATSILIMKDEK